MDDKVTSDQQRAIVNMLQEAMQILMDDKPLDRHNSKIGKIRWVKKSHFSESGDVYSFENDAIPESEIKLYTVDDPLDYPDDRSKVSIVPSSFELSFYVVVIGITPAMLKEQLDLADYWIDGDGQKHPYNDMGPGILPMPGLHRYRYLANPQSDSRFPVNVELSFGDGSSSKGVSVLSSLGRVEIKRAYPPTSPHLRKKAREKAVARGNAEDPGQ